MDARIRAIVQVTEAYQWSAAAVLYMARACLKRDDRAKSAKHVGGIEDAGDLVGRFYAVLERHDQSIRAHHGLHGASRCRYLPGFDATQYIIDDADIDRVIGHLDAVDNKVTRDAADLEALRS